MMDLHRSCVKRADGTAADHNLSGYILAGVI